jgi:hypothetical protein
MLRFFKRALFDVMLFLVAYGVFSLVRLIGLAIVAVIAIVISALIILGTYIDGRK